tara:strand:+ start:41 stop:487 length:447 start_codon:yes stop_codon:yes gene_type:complete
MDKRQEEYIRIVWHGKLDLSGDDWVEHLKYSNSLNLPYNASPEDRRRVSKLKTEDLLRRMERRDVQPEKVTEWLGTDTYDWNKPEKVQGEYQFPKELSLWNKLLLSAQGIGHNAVQGFDNPMPLREGIKKRQFPNWHDTRGLLDAIWD